MAERTEKLSFIATHLRLHHIGWKNAISMKALAAAAGLTPSLLKADRTNKRAGYIPELRKQGHPILSCNQGYYWPRPETDPTGREEDFKKHASRLTGQGKGSLYAVAEAKRASKYAGELRLEFE